MSTKFTTARLVVGGDRFEILVHPDNALAYKMGKKVEISQVIAVEEVYSDASKGLRVPTEKLIKHFRSDDPLVIAEEILKRGELQLTSEQRSRLLDDKRRQIVAIISRTFVDPKTNLPHPPVRIEQAMKEAHVSIDPFREAEEQAKQIVEQLRRVLPLKAERVKLSVKVPAQFAGKCIGVMKSFGEIEKEEWGADGSLHAILDIPAGVQSSLVERLASITKGRAEANPVR